MRQQLVRLVSSPYAGTESAVKCVSDISDFFPVSSGVKQGCTMAPALLNSCMDWIMGTFKAVTGCGVSFGDARISDPDFTDDASLLAELVDSLDGALDTTIAATLFGQNQDSVLWEHLG